MSFADNKIIRRSPFIRIFCHCCVCSWGREEERPWNEFDSFIASYSDIHLARHIHMEPRECMGSIWLLKMGVQKSCGYLLLKENCLWLKIVLTKSLVRMLV